MADIRTQIGEIAYNPASERFEALVTFHSSLGRLSVAASVAAPLTADFDTVTDGLLRDALTGFSQPQRLRAQVAPVPSAPVQETLRAA